MVNPLIARHKYRLVDAVNDFLKEKSGSNYMVYNSALSKLIDVMGRNTFVRDIDTLQPYYDYLLSLDNSNIKQELLKKKISVNTAYTYMLNVRVFFNWLFKNKYISEHPQYPRAKSVKTKRVPCPFEVVTKALDYLITKEDKNQYLSILILLLTGIRIGELCRLKWEDFDFKNKTLNIENQKEGRVDEFPIYPTMAKLLKPFKQKSGKVVIYSGRNSFRFWKRTLNHLKLPYHNIHSIRKTFATELGRARTPDKVLMDIVRHKNIKTSLGSYIFSEFDEMRKYAEKAIGGRLK